MTAGRFLLAALFLAGALQKLFDPGASQNLLSGVGLPVWLVWPALVFNACAAGMLVANVAVRAVGRALALYCIVTSAFHWVPDDPWQISIMIKNWAIAGGCLILSGAAGKHAVVEAHSADRQ